MIVSEGIERWNDRRIELVRKREAEPLSARETEELALVTRAVDYYVRQAAPGHTLETLQAMVRRWREHAADPFSIPG